MKRAALTTTIVVTTCIAARSDAQVCDPILKGEIHELSISDIEVASNRAYIGGNGLTVLDLTTPASPSIIDSYSPGNGFTRGLVITADHAFLTADRTLIAIDISDDSGLPEAGRVTLPGAVGQLDIAADLVAFSGQHFGLVDITDPAEMNLLWSVEAEQPNMVALSQAALFVQTENEQRIYDIANPSAPQIAYSETVETRSLDAEIVGDTLFRLVDHNTLVTTDISDPSAPLTLQSIPLDAFAASFDIDGDTLAVELSSEPGYLTIDISDPSDMVINRPTDVVEDSTGIAIGSDLVVVAQDHRNIHVIDASVPDSLSVIGEFIAPGRIEYAVMHDDAVFVPYLSKIYVYDKSDLSSIRFRANIDIGHWDVTRIWFSGDTMYVAQESERISIVDITYPFAPVLLDRIEIRPTLMNTDGNRLYVREHWDLVIFDISDPVSPVELSRLQLGQFQYIEATEDYLYLPFGTQTLIVDVRDATNPFLAGSFPGTADRFVIRDDLAYRFPEDNVSRNVGIYSLANPLEPEHIGTVTLDWNIRGINPRGQQIDAIVFPGNGLWQLRTYFLQDANTALWQGARTIGGSPEFLQTQDDLIIIPGAVPGAPIFRLQDCPGLCGPADISPPLGVLDLADITTFVNAFTFFNPAADLAEPTGVLDLADIVAFVTAFNAGCP